MFAVLVTPSINTFEALNDFMILIISCISSFEISKKIVFPALKSSFPLIFLQNLFIAFEAKLLNNPGNFF